MKRGKNSHAKKSSARLALGLIPPSRISDTSSGRGDRHLDTGGLRTNITRRCDLDSLY